MKNSLLAFCLALVLQFGYAQDKPEIPACLIVYGGLNMSSLQDFDYFFLSDANPGFSGGAMIRTDEDFFFSAGLHYVEANPTLTSRDGGGSEKVSFQLLQLPLMAGLKIVKSQDNARALRIQLGPSLSTLLNVSDNDLGITKDVIDKTLFTVKAGVGADLGRFVADINYNLLVSNLYDIAGANNEAHLKAWEFTLGYKINIKKKAGDQSE